VKIIFLSNRLFDFPLRASKGYVATRLAIDRVFSVVNFVNPDANSVDYLRSQYGGKIAIKVSSDTQSHNPMLVSKRLWEGLNGSNYRILYANPEKSGLLILRK